MWKNIKIVRINVFIVNWHETMHDYKKSWTLSSVFCWHGLVKVDQHSVLNGLNHENSAIKEVCYGH